MKPVDIITKCDKRAEIYYDELAESPRGGFFCDGWIGKMVCMHRNYILGDEQLRSGDYESWDEVAKYLTEECNAKVILPLYLHDHSSLSMSTGSFNDCWDSGQVGFIYADEDKCIKEFGDDYKYSEVEKILRSEVDVYDDYLSGQVYGYKIFEKVHVVDRCPHCNEILDEYDYEDEIDSCWGFYGLGSVREAVADVL
jgi:hypothetical protein